MEREGEVESLRWVLAEAIAWSLPHVALGHVLSTFWSEQLKPDGWRNGPPWPSGLSDFRSDLEVRAVVDEVIQRRRQLLAAEDRSPTAPAYSLAEGRLLVYTPEQSLWDGAAETATQGFFDTDNAPPWDTWIGYVVESMPGKDKRMAGYDFWRAYLVGWVPPQLVNLVESGLDANPERCVVWAEDLDSSFTSSLRSARIL